MKLIIATTFCFAICAANAAEVLWDLFSSSPGDPREPGIQLYYYGHGTGVGNIQPEIGVLYGYTEGTLTSINGFGPANIGINGTIWIDAVYGDVLTDDYFAAFFAANERVFNDHGFFDPCWIPETIYVRDVIYGETIYVSFAGLAADDAHYYGWLELLAKEDELSLVSSALTYSPGLIVGTGSFSGIPEPSAGTLLLLGLAGLALCRRR